MKNSVLLPLFAAFLFAISLFHPASGWSKDASGCTVTGDLTPKIVKALETIWGPNVARTFKDARVESCFIPKKGKDWEVVVFKMRVPLQNGKSADYPVTAVKLDGEFFLTPAFISLEDARNYAVLWNALVKEPANLPHDPKFLVAGDPQKCSHSLEVFTDPECPFCQRFVPKFVDLAAKKGFCVYHYCYPLDFHKNAEKYCKMLEVALEKLPPDKRKDFLVSFYETVKKKEDPESLAMNASGLKPDMFYKAVLDKDLSEIKKLAEEVGVRGTPTFFVDGKRVPNQFLEDYLDFVREMED